MPVCITALSGISDININDSTGNKIIKANTATNIECAISNLPFLLDVTLLVTPFVTGATGIFLLYCLNKTRQIKEVRTSNIESSAESDVSPLILA